MEAWNEAFAFTLDYEGGWADNPNDRGGETYRGISRKNWPNWEGWETIDAEHVREGFPSMLYSNVILAELVRQFYLKNFWAPICGDQLPRKMAIAAFDCAVNSGVGRAVRLMQIALGVTADGNIGPVTIKAAFDRGESGVIEFLARRAKFLHEIMDNDPTQKVWAMNWFRRLFKLANLVLEG
jgi:lysozyme family protein